MVVPVMAFTVQAASRSGSGQGSRAAQGIHWAVSVITVLTPQVSFALVCFLSLVSNLPSTSGLTISYQINSFSV